MAFSADLNAFWSIIVYHASIFFVSSTGSASLLWLLIDAFDIVKFFGVYGSCVYGEACDYSLGSYIEPVKFSSLK